jgi:hypothetical protein
MKRLATPIRGVYHALAALALLHVAALFGAGGVMLATGRLKVDRAREALAVLRGQAPSTVQAAPVAETAPDAQPPAETILDVGPPISVEQELLHREADRIRADLEHRVALNNRIMLRVTTEREAFQKERVQAQRQDQTRSAQRNEEGFRKLVEIMEALSPAAALDLLIGMPDADEAARLMFEMDARKARNIVEAAGRNPAQADRIRLILERIGQTAPATADGTQGS